jgi:2-oxoglutarate dehydrogenase E2 component (dihydrolipoamide succinyltransferase)
MSIYKLLMPKMGEGVIEATVINWMKREGDFVKEDETILEVATDKVDTEIQSPVSGKIYKINFEKDQVVSVGEVLVLIETEGSEVNENVNSNETQILDEIIVNTKPFSDKDIESKPDLSEFRLTPLVRNMIRENKISPDELKIINGTGANSKLTKRDILALLGQRNNISPIESVAQKPTEPSKYFIPMEGDEIMEMNRMRKLISQHMLDSKQIAPHVTSVVESDLTDLVIWREKIKDVFFKKNKVKITFLPIFVEAVAKALKDFPNINASVNGDKLILRKNINIGIATALPSGNLIVPVIKNANQYNLEGLTLVINDLIVRARENKLKPDEISGGTFTITNLGTMGNILGTPIINQPQVAILATGVIVKKPAVLETELGDVIAIRNKVYLSLSYDHRVVDGFLGGSFLKRISDYLENFNIKPSF